VIVLVDIGDLVLQSYQIPVYQLLEISDVVMINDLIGIDNPIFLELSDISISYQLLVTPLC